ncbi:MAG: hypothetical protein O7C61_07830, partial [SAR324 cluster bacterium]|nr:hypothetical protein [SAR324 cluster bacterium]
SAGEKGIGRFSVVLAKRLKIQRFPICKRINEFTKGCAPENREFVSQRLPPNLPLSKHLAQRC